MKVIKFGTPGCDPCIRMAPYFEEAKELFTEVEFASVNPEESPLLAAKYRVRGIPTFIVLDDNGSVVAVTTGMKQKKAFFAWLEENV
jgi:thioredoxin 2